MRRMITLAAAGFAVAATFLPVSPANAVCIKPWQTVTGQCSPCTTADSAARALERFGVEIGFECLA